MSKPLLFLIIGWGLMLSGCTHSSGAIWEDTKTVGRRLHRKARLLWRKDIDSRMVESEDDFTAPIEEEYIPYHDDDIQALKTEFTVPAPKDDPGALGGNIPGIKDFTAPKGPLLSLFRTLRFATDSHALRTEEHQIIAKIAHYMATHQELYVFVEGHCDERASEDYNLALGTRRANSVRAALVKLGVDPNRVFTVSFGKELPLDSGHTTEAWAKNRRVMFKLFENNQRPLQN
ncbi:MAG: OmpA family protein [Chlamydiota bacterium]